MADLDDFFAKKDRKKGKTTVKKFTTAEELAKRIEDTAKKADAKPRKVVTVGGAGSAAAADGTGAVDPATAIKPVEPVVEEEWKEFEEERKDYSGLKLAQLNIVDQEGNRDNLDGEDRNEIGGSNDGDSGNGGGDKTGSGAWKKLDDSSTPSDRQQQQQQQQTPQLQSRPGSSVYMAPSLRNRPTKKGAPDLKNEEFFPTLGTEVPDPKIKKDSTFEEVKHGGRVRQSDLPSAAPLSVGNRFTSLSNDAS